MAPETYSFSADIAQLMGVIINTVYSNREIFLRELVANASDALERAAASGATWDGEEPCIRVAADREAGTLTVEDNGVGMTREELVDNLGTVARSKTKSFLETVAAGGGVEPALIGQFGIGFYSAYVASDVVRVVSKSDASAVQSVWQSAAGGSFTVAPDVALEHGVLRRGTKVICFLKEDQADFLDPGYLRLLLSRHCCFVKWPILLLAPRPTASGTGRPFLPQLGEAEGADPAEAATCEIPVRVWELVNRVQPVWLQPAAAVTASAYSAVYRWLNMGATEPLAFRRVDGSGDRRVDFRALLFCDRTARGDVFDLVGGRTSGARIRLYVRRVFVKEFEDLLPRWMSFISGVVDSDDLPLNISREQLQRESAVMRHIQRALVRECFELLHQVAEDSAAFTAFQEVFSHHLKMGMHEDADSRPHIAPLLRYYTSLSVDALVSLEEYVGRMKPGQRHILYVTGRSRRHALHSPLIEGFKRDGCEVLLMGDPADEFALQFLKEYKGVPLLSATSFHAGCEGLGGPALPGVGGGPDLQPLCQRMQRVLAAAGREAAVKVGGRLEGSAFPAALLVGEGGEPTLLLLDGSHSLFWELGGRESLDGCEAELVLLIHDLAAALAPGRGADSTEVRRRLGERLQGMVRELDGAGREAEEEDLPVLAVDHPTAAPVDAPSRRARASAAGVGPYAVGRWVRVTQNGIARRAMVTYFEEGAGTVDVIYHGAGQGVEEEEGLDLRLVASLLPFEEQECAISPDNACALGPAGGGSLERDFLAAAAQVKEQGNALFNLRDFEAAAEQYTAIIAAVRAARADTGHVVLRVVDIHEAGRARRALKPGVVRRVFRDAGTRGVEYELTDGSRVAASQVLPVLGLGSLRPLLEQVRAFRPLTEEVLENIAAAAAAPAMEHVAVQAAAWTNRARCRAAMEAQQEAAQDLTVALALWESLEAYCPHMSPEERRAVDGAVCRATYLRAKSRLRRGLAHAAATDTRAALSRQPAPEVARQLKLLQAEACAAAVGEQRRVREPLARELAKVVFALRSASL